VVAPERLADLLKTFARTLVAEYSISELLHRLCKDTTAVMEVDGAGVMLEDEAGDLRFVAASDDLVGSIEELQIELGEGPCQEAFRSGEQVLVGDVATDRRFPLFSPRAHQVGISAVYSFPLRSDSEVIGALNVYTADPSDLDDETLEAGRLIADVATTYLLNARTLAESHQLSGQLQRALTSRIVIEQAKGKLSEQLDTSVEEAFEIMRRYARNNGARLHDVAAQVVAGTLRLSADESS
jgi:GAF domain-containing protein